MLVIARDHNAMVLLKVVRAMCLVPFNPDVSVISVRIPVAVVVPNVFNPGDLSMVRSTGLVVGALQVLAAFPI